MGFGSERGGQDCKAHGGDRGALDPGVQRAEERALAFVGECCPSRSMGGALFPSSIEDSE
jgi:hypothetical protein